MPNPILRDNDRKVRVYQNGTPVSASPLQSVYAKYLNFIGLTVTENAPLDAYDISAGATTDEKVISYVNGTQVGSVARRLNFSTDFTGSDDAVNGRTNIALATPSASTVLPDGTTTTKSKIGTFFGGSLGFNGLLAGAVINGDDQLSELTSTDMFTTFTNTGGATGDFSGFSTPFLMTRRDYNPTFKIRFKGSPTSQKMFIGFYDAATPPAGATNPMTSHHGAAFGYNTDSTFAAWWGAGGTAQKSTASLPSKNMTVHDLTISLNATSVVMVFDGATVVNSSTSPPGSTTSLALHATMEDAGSDPSLGIVYCYVIQDR